MESVTLETCGPHSYVPGPSASFALACRGEIFSNSDLGETFASPSFPSLVLPQMSDPHPSLKDLLPPPPASHFSHTLTSLEAL